MPDRRPATTPTAGEPVPRAETGTWVGDGLVRSGSAPSAAGAAGRLAEPGVRALAVPACRRSGVAARRAESGHVRRHRLGHSHAVPDVRRTSGGGPVFRPCPLRLPRDEPADLRPGPRRTPGVVVPDDRGVLPGHAGRESRGGAVPPGVAESATRRRDLFLLRRTPRWRRFVPPGCTVRRTGHAVGARRVADHPVARLHAPCRTGPGHPLWSTHRGRCTPARSRIWRSR